MKTDVPRAMFRLFVCVSVLGASLVLAADSDLGAKLPENSRAVGEHRFRSPTDWTGTLKYYKTTYTGANYPRKAIINQPNVRAIHIVNASGKGQWEGLNIYETNDEVRITVVAAETSAIAK
jgi:hypothetical protein